MANPLDLLEQILIEAASSCIVVSDFEEIEGEDNAKALFDLQDERDAMLLSLLNYTHEYGGELMNLVRKGKIERHASSEFINDHVMMKALRGE